MHSLTGIKQYCIKENCLTDLYDLIRTHRSLKHLSELRNRNRGDVYLFIYVLLRNELKGIIDLSRRVC